MPGLGTLIEDSLKSVPILGTQNVSIGDVGTEIMPLVLFASHVSSP
jgi:hypothetical protein